MVIFKAIEPSSLTIEESRKNEFWHESNDIVLSIFCYALILSQTHKDRLHLSKKNEDGYKATQYHPATSVEKHAAHKILFCTNGLWSKGLDCTVDTNKRLVTK